jgi:dCMP deaminase
MTSPFEQMQKAVDIVNTSPHPKNKISATIFGKDLKGKSFSISKTNFWPEVIAKNFDQEERIGNASGTIHAETACIFSAAYTEGSSLCATDPFCPNCAKNIAEAGIKNLYIDHKGFGKDFASRREIVFKKMSLEICKKAGINVYELHRKENKLIPIYEVPNAYKPTEENPVILDKKTPSSFKEYILQSKSALQDVKYAIAIAKDNEGKNVILRARDHPVLGYSLEKDINEIENPEQKYSFIQEPVNRVLMTASRKGVSLTKGKLYCSQIPTSREQVNMVGAGITQIYIGNIERARDEFAFKAMSTLKEKNIIQYIEI